MPKQTKLSPIWDYYTETDDPKYAQCKLCKEKKSLGSNNPRERTFTVKSIYFTKIKNNSHIFRVPSKSEKIVSSNDAAKFGHVEIINILAPAKKL